MRLWIASFVLDIRDKRQWYELMISAPTKEEARGEVDAWFERYDCCKKFVDLSTLTMRELDIQTTRVVKVFDRGSVV